MPDEPTYLDVAEAWAKRNESLLSDLVEHWLKSGEWMTVRQLGTLVLQRDDVEIHDELRQIPVPLGRAETPEERVELRVRALADVAASAEVLDGFVDVVRLIGERMRTEPPERQKLYSTDVLKLPGVPQDLVARVEQVVHGERWMFGSRTGDADWEWELTERAVRLRHVATLEQYLDVEGRQWNIPASRSLHAASPLIDRLGDEAHDGPRALDEETFLRVADLHPEIAEATAGLVADGHYASAVRAANVALRDLLRHRTDRHDLDGANLVDATLGGRSPPLALVDLARNYGKDEQAGWHKLAVGWVAAIRNATAHRDEFKDRSTALEAIALMSLIAHRIDTARGADQDSAGEAGDLRDHE